MNTIDWTPYYKLDEHREPCHAQMAYEPLMSPDQAILCMNFDTANTYQDYQNKLGFIPDIVHEFYNLELKYLTKFKDYSWAPTVLEVTPDKIFIEWNKITCNDIIQSGELLDTYCLNWKQQLKTIILDHLNEKVYRLSLYPHCFFIKDGQLTAFDCYMSFDFDNCVLPADKVKGLIHKTTEGRIAEASKDSVINMKTLFLKGLETHIKWPDNYLTEIYNELYN